MGKTVILVPKEGLSIPDPRTLDRLPKEGRRVRLNTYWNRRIAEGSVIVREEKASNQILPKGGYKK